MKPFKNEVRKKLCKIRQLQRARMDAKWEAQFINILGNTRKNESHRKAMPKMGAEKIG
jgi:hypothetical protein